MLLNFVINFVLKTIILTINYVVFKILMGHFEGDNPGHNWKSAAWIVFVPLLLIYGVGEIFSLLTHILKLPDSIYANTLLIIGAILTSFLFIIPSGIAITKWRYSLGWGYSIVLYLGVWILTFVLINLMEMLAHPIILIIMEEVSTIQNNVK